MVSAAALLVGLLVASAVLSGWPSGPKPSRLPGATRPLPSANGRPTGPDPPIPARTGTPRTGTARLAAAAATALGVGVFLGGEVGVVAGALAGVLAWLWLGRLEPATVRRRRERIEADLPHAVDLLAACLAGGHAPGQAVDQVCRAVGGPVGEELALISARLRLGVDPLTVWTGLGQHPQLGALGRCVARATDSGASVAAAMDRLAQDLRREARARVESQARAVGVRAALPLGVCLLPAFVLMGVVPLVAGSVGTLLGP